MVDNQHKKISGYRDLTEREIELMNSCKSLGEAINRQIAAVAAEPDIDPRCLAIARTEFQTAMMWLVRSIARPEGF